MFRLREPLYEKCKGKMNTTTFGWKFDMIRRKPCRAMIGCHSLESRFDSNQNKQLYDFEVEAFRSENGNTQTFKIKEDHKRQYWNLERAGESIGLILEYNSTLVNIGSRLPSVMCFAWCNSDMSDQAPRIDNEDISSNSPVDEIINELVM